MRPKRWRCSTGTESRCAFTICTDRHRENASWGHSSTRVFTARRNTAGATATRRSATGRRGSATAPWKAARCSRTSTTIPADTRRAMLSGSAIKSAIMSQPERIAGWMRRQLTAAGARGSVVGLSGGIDSAVVARLAQLAAPGHVLAAILPSHSDPQDEADAVLVAKTFSLPVVRVDLTPIYESFAAAAQDALKRLPLDMRPAAPADPLRGRVPLANMKPRLRMTTLYYFANTLNYLVAGTGNRSELAIGYFTKYGDGGCDLLPIGRLVKREVRAMAADLKVPR